MSDTQTSKVLTSVAGSGVAAARCLVEGRRVLSKLSGYLGVIVSKDEDNHVSQEHPDDAVRRHFKVRLVDNRTYWYARDQIEAWTRGVFVTSKRSGKHGEIIRVDQRVPPAARPYLVRLDDGREFWYALHDVHFLNLQRRGTSRSLETTRRQAERCDLILVPGRWRLSWPSFSVDNETTNVTIHGTPGGDLQGTGDDSKGAFVLKGTDRTGLLDLRLDYVDCEGAVADVEGLTGAWEVKDFSVKPKWAAVENGHVFVAGAEVGFFRARGGHFDYTDRNLGTVRRFLAHSVDMLCVDDGSVWCRLQLEASDALIATSCSDTIHFDPPKCSKQESDGVCNVTRIEVAPCRAIGVAFEAECTGLAPDALKTQLRIDGRVVDAHRGEYSASVSKGKRRRSRVAGTLFFNEVLLRVGSSVSLRYGGEYSGYSWAELVCAPAVLSDLSIALYNPQNHLRTRYLQGHVSGDGLSAEGLLSEGSQVSVSGRTASDIIVSRLGRLTTVSLKPYSDDDLANIEIRGPAVIRFTFFKTEATYDVMEIAGIEYSGEELPPPHFVPEGMRLIMKWSSDESTTDEGWEMTVLSGISHVKLADREAGFGAREAPWNQAEAPSHFAGPLVHISSNAFGLQEFESRDVAGRVLVISAGCDTDEETSNKDESSKASLSDVQLFAGPLYDQVANAERAGARAVIFVASDWKAPGVMPDGDSQTEDGPSLNFSMPAVIIGNELGREIIEALGRNEVVTTGPLTHRFRLELEEPLKLDGSRDVAQLSLGSDNLLRAMVAASRDEIRRFPSSQIPLELKPLESSTELWRVVEKMCKPFGSDSLVKTSFEEASQVARVGKDERQLSEEQVLCCLHELIRRLMPIMLPPKALLPSPEVTRCGGVWDHYRKGQCLGEGSFGVVHQAWDRFTGNHVAVKTIKLKEDSKGSEKDVVKEFELLRDLSHPNLVRVLDLYVSDKEVFVVTDYAARGDLNCFIACPAKVDEQWVAVVTRQVLAACGFLHHRHIVHHDVKPANVLVTHIFLQMPEAHIPLILLADFGLSQVEQFTANEAQKVSGAGNGTACYMAPESANLLSGPKTDAYACGIMLYELLSGGSAPDAITDEGETDEVDWGLLAHCSAHAVNATKSLIAPEIGERISCMDALQIHWFWPFASPHPRVHDSNDGLAGRGGSREEKRRNEEQEFVDKEGTKLTCARCVERLERNVSVGFLSRAAMNLFIGQLSLLELDPIRREFEAFDVDHDGVLSEAEIASGFLACGRQESAAREAMLAADVHRRGALEFREFAAACIDLGDLPQPSVYGVAEKIFAQLGGPSGELTFQTVLDRCVCQDDCDIENLADLFNSQDRHGDGHWTKEEFLRLWGVTPIADWSQPSLEPKPALVRVLRGDIMEAWTEGSRVVARSFATFGQPNLGRTEGRWYYELHIGRFDSPQVGWADESFEVTEAPSDDGVGDDEHSWGVDGERQCKWHGGSNDYKGAVSPWPHPLVLGCAIDLGPNSNRQMLFSVDGQWDSAPAFEGFEPNGEVYPAASGILGGVFAFSATECIHRPPASSYDFLV